MPDVWGRRSADLLGLGEHSDVLGYRQGPDTGGLVVFKSGGARASGVGGGSKAVLLPARSGGAVAEGSGGGERVVLVAKVGGGVLGTLAGGARVVVVLRAGGAVLHGVGGGAFVVVGGRVVQLATKVRLGPVVELAVDMAAELTAQGEVVPVSLVLVEHGERLPVEVEASATRIVEVEVVAISELEGEDRA